MYTDKPSRFVKKGEGAMQKGQRVRVKQDVPFTTYNGKVGKIIDAYRDVAGKARYAVRFDDGGGSVYYAEELQVIDGHTANHA